MNTYIKYLILAIIQGITEILPISSSAHLIIFSSLLDLPSNDLSLAIFLHLSSAIAVIFFLRKRIWQLLKGFFLFIFKKKCKSEFMTVIFLIIASIPAGFAGFFLQDYIEQRLTTPFSIGLCFIITGFLLIFCSKKSTKEKSIEEIKPLNALSIGIFQMIGILPGISRSGITYSGTRLNKLSIKDASEFIFLLFIPISLGSALLEGIKLISNTSLSSINIGPLLIAMLVTAIITFACLHLFLLMLKKNKMYIFSYYLFPLGIMLMIKGLYQNAWIWPTLFR